MDFVAGLNAMQKEAVLHTEGPLLVLAGAGSGKTRVLTHRIAHLIKNKDVAPWSILAITFTNKAAAEMRERVGGLIGDDLARDMWISTFHSMCVRMLRRDGERLGYGRYFTIYDTSDQKALMKDVMKTLNVNEKNFPVSSMIGAISSKKNEFILPEDCLRQVGGDYREKVIAQIYEAYQAKLKENNAMDFDDLLVNTCLVLQNNPDVLEFYQRKFKYILVDEYQDTNGVQYHLVQLLAKGHYNLCVVGDDDQSIYGWRGADISNILDFERDLPGAKVIKLEQNYRSTKNILEAANKVVARNQGRKVKNLWTDNEEGEVISVMELDNEYRESDAIANLISRGIENGEREYKDYAILYRTNAQSRAIEEKMIHHSIPYRLLGGTRFYERKEIKDLIAYLRVVANLKDDIALKRVINVPKRGIGAASVNTIAEYAQNQNMDFFEAARMCKEFGVLGNAPSTKVLTFVYLIQEFRAMSQNGDVKELLEAIIEKTEYTNYLRQTEGEDAKDRIANIQELVSKAATYMQNSDDPSLDEFLEEVALVADVDNYDEESNSVVLMTLHSAKGLEFPVVFMPGMEDGLFPSFMSMTEGDDKLEEERRLCYVGITRAREKLYMLYTQQRTVFGRTQSSIASRFLKELPTQVTNLQELEKTPSSSGRFINGKTNPLSPFSKNPINKPSFGQATPQTAPGKTSFTKPDFTKPEFIQRQATKSEPTPSIPNRGILPAAGGKIENLPKVTQDFSSGDMVKHKMFGEGTITKVDKTEDDVFVTIDFKRGMSKKLSVRFAKLQKM
ncbi:MAG: DNA helicase PcrA [Cellulosilyticaceae bacterium]